MAEQPVAPANAEISVGLTDFATAYKNSQFIADMVSPTITVTEQSDEYPKRTRRDMAAIEDNYVGPRGEIPEVTYDIDTGLYRVKGRGFKAAVPEALKLAADPALTVEQSATNLTLQHLLLAREARVADLVMTQGNWAAGNTSAAGNYWTDKTSGTPVADIMAAKEAIPFNGDDVRIIGVCSDKVFNTLIQHPDVKDLRGGGDTRGGLLSTTELANALGLDDVYTSAVYKRTSDRGVAATFDRVWSSTDFALVLAPENLPDPNASVFSVTFRFMLPGANPNGIRIRRWNVPSEGLGGTDYVAAETKDDEVVVQNDAGYLIRDVRAS